jgi:hypothetical protein
MITIHVGFTAQIAPQDADLADKIIGKAIEERFGGTAVHVVADSTRIIAED